MRKLAAFALVLAMLALASACGDATNSNNSNANLSNLNRATNANNANAANVNTANTNRRIDPNITEAEYERDKDRYGREAKEAGDTIGSGLKDGWLHIKTKGALLAADDLRDSTINVDVDNANVTLRGSVASAAQKTKAETVAKGIDGVKTVKNQLAVKADPDAANANNANHKGGAH